MRPGSRKGAKAQRGTMPFLAALRLGVKRLAVWVRRHLIRFTSPKPERFIFMVAQRNGWAAYLLPRHIPGPTVVKTIIFALADQTGLVVAIACPRKDLASALKRKFIYSQWN